MSRSINIRIAGKEYPIAVSGPENERLMRLAAEDLNARLSRYESKFPGISMLDKLAFVALNEAAGKQAVQDELNSLNAGLSSLEKEIGSYLDGIENNR